MLIIQNEVVFVYRIEKGLARVAFGKKIINSTRQRLSRQVERIVLLLLLLYQCVDYLP